MFHTTVAGGVDYMDRLPLERERKSGRRGGDGVLAVLVAGASPPDPGEFVGSPRLSRLLAELAVRFDVVLIDTPPLLSVGDAMTLSAHVDGMIAVARLELLKRPVLQELSRALATCPSLKLGYIVTGAEIEPGYGHTGYQYYDRGEGYDVNLPVPVAEQGEGLARCRSPSASSRPIEHGAVADLEPRANDEPAEAAAQATSPSAGAARDTGGAGSCAGS